MRRFVLLVSLSVVCAHVSPAQEWSRFRGPNGAGISDSKSIPVKWTEKDYNWRIELPGRGGSSPIVWKDQVYMTSADEEKGERYLLCLSTKDGKEKWTATFPLKKYKKQRNNTFAGGTPCADADHVYVLWQAKDQSLLVALNHQGEEKWRIDLGPYNHGQGGAVSPIVHKDRVIIANDHAEGSFLLAVDRMSGKEIWKIPRKGKRACYSTPCIHEPEGRPTEIIFTHSFEGVTGHDFKTGRMNWHIDPFGRFPQRAIASPILAGDLIIAGSGFTTKEKNFVAVSLSNDGERIKAEEVYRVSRSVPHIPTPIAHEGLLFFWGDNGIVRCVEVKTGKSIRKARVGGEHFGSPVCVDGRLYCISKRGEVAVVTADNDLEVLATNDLGEESQSTPAVSDGVMYLRTYSHLISLGGNK